MDAFLSLLGLLTMLAASLLILKCFGFKGAPVVSAIAMIALSSMLFEKLSSAVSFLDGLRDLTKSKYVDSAIRIIGIGYLGGIGADVCRELGEGGAARCITLASRLELIAIALPYISEIFSSVTELMRVG